MGFLDKGPRSATVRAIADTVCLAVDVFYLLKLEEEGQGAFQVAIYKMFSQILASRLRDTIDKYIEVKKELDGLIGNL
jgi:CRP-like cAMP-binding protein|tara:strand:- start:274 stop:507 length:234 start_codon:yes stop_codon:yes gene_type:complete